MSHLNTAFKLGAAQAQYDFNVELAKMGGMFDNAGRTTPSAVGGNPGTRVGPRPVGDTNTLGSGFNPSVGAQGMNTALPKGPAPGAMAGAGGGGMAMKARPFGA